MKKTIIVCTLFLALASCSDNGDKQSRPDPEIEGTPTDTTGSGTSNASGAITDSNAAPNGGRTGDSAGTRSPDMSKDSSLSK